MQYMRNNASLQVSSRMNNHPSTALLRWQSAMASLFTAGFMLWTMTAWFSTGHGWAPYAERLSIATFHIRLLCMLGHPLAMGTCGGRCTAEPQSCHDYGDRAFVWVGFCTLVHEELLRDVVTVNVSFQSKHTWHVRPKGMFMVSNLYMPRHDGMRCEDISRLLFSPQSGHVAVNKDVPFKLLQPMDKGCLCGQKT